MEDQESEYGNIWIPGNSQNSFIMEMHEGIPLSYLNSPSCEENSLQYASITNPQPPPHDHAQAPHDPTHTIPIEAQASSIHYETPSLDAPPQDTHTTPGLYIDDFTFPAYDDDCTTPQYLTSYPSPTNAYATPIPYYPDDCINPSLKESYRALGHTEAPASPVSEPQEPWWTCIPGLDLDLDPNPVHVEVERGEEPRASVEDDMFQTPVDGTYYPIYTPPIGEDTRVVPYRHYQHRHQSHQTTATNPTFSHPQHIPPNRDHTHAPIPGAATLPNSDPDPRHLHPTTTSQSRKRSFQTYVEDTPLAPLSRFEISGYANDEGIGTASTTPFPPATRRSSGSLDHDGGISHPTPSHHGDRERNRPPKPPDSATTFSSLEHGGDPAPTLADDPGSSNQTTREPCTNPFHMHPASSSSLLTSFPSSGPLAVPNIPTPPLRFCIPCPHAGAHTLLPLPNSSLHPSSVRTSPGPGFPARGVLNPLRPVLHFPWWREHLPAGWSGFGKLGRGRESKPKTRGKTRGTKDGRSELKGDGDGDGACDGNASSGSGSRSEERRGKDKRGIERYRHPDQEDDDESSTYNLTCAPPGPREEEDTSTSRRENTSPSNSASLFPSPSPSPSTSNDDDEFQQNTPELTPRLLSQLRYDFFIRRLPLSTILSNASSWGLCPSKKTDRKAVQKWLENTYGAGRGDWVGEDGRRVGVAEAWRRGREREEVGLGEVG
ncbi:hypothetical protein M501DRAFT_989539 [Patellaria atrata CBS 101060]|uniref:Uncharacterized protein n=1 Tax=Patellaria atrata CBS 101060 TaxID=1346257 RepID=A0A9P4S2S1_9PEZI|nr:hypothetical protein M501DRAFT_989539 [Patellaria atrata CBS 101060]